MNTNFKSKNHQSMKESEFYEALITILQSTAHHNKIGATVNSATVFSLNFTGWC